MRARQTGPDILLRTIGVLMVVYHHAAATLFKTAAVPLHGLGLKGGMTILVLVSGFSFARLGLRAGDPAAAKRALVSYGRALAIPSLIAILCFSALSGSFDIRQVLMIGNWFPGLPLPGFFAWYPQALVQLFVLLYLLFSIPPVARWFFDHLLAGSLALIGVGLALRLGQRFASGVTFTQLPHMILWNFCLGWAILLALVARGGWPRVLASAGAAVVAMLGWGPGALSSWTLLAAALVLIWVPSLRLPAIVHRLLMIVSQASLAIFLLHIWIIRAIKAHAPFLAPNAPVAFLITTLACVALWLAYASCTRAYAAVKLRAVSAPQ